jgi:hypothetical protein
MSEFRRKLSACVLLLLATAVSAQPPISCFTGQMYGRDAMIGLAVLIMVFIVALAYMLSQIMHRPEWAAWSKNEAYQVFFSCVLAVSMIAIADVGCWISWELTLDPVTGNSGGDAFEVTNAFLSTHYDSGISLIYQIYFLKTITDYLGQFHIMLGTNPMFIVQTFPGIIALSQSFEVAIVIITVLVANIMVQKMIFQIIQDLAFNVVLPVGLLLRVFPPSRGAGAFLIAVAFGFYIVFPLTYVMASEVLVQLPSESRPALLGGLPGFPILGPGFLAIFSFLFGPMTLFYYAIKDLNIILVATFFPALNITITITFIKCLTRAITHHMG